MCCTPRMIPRRTSLCSYRSIHHFSSDSQKNNPLSAYLNSYTKLRFFFSLQMDESPCIVKSHAVRSLTFDQSCPASF